MIGALVSGFRRQVDMWRRASLARRGFDQPWLRYGASLCAAGFIAGAILDYANRTAAWAGWLGAGFGIALFVYFAQLLFLRLQCSLVQWLTIVTMLGTAEGLLFSLPLSLGVKALFATHLAAWIFYGAEIGLSQVILLQTKRPLASVGLLLLAWWSSAAPVLLACAVALKFLEHSTPALVSANMSAWSLPLAIAGLLGLMTRWFFARKAVRAARQVLADAAA